MCNAFFLHPIARAEAPSADDKDAIIERNKAALAARKAVLLCTYSD